METDQAVRPHEPPEGDGHDLADIRRRLTANFPLVDHHPDVAGVLRDPDLLGLVAYGLAAPFHDRQVDLVVAAEARGPILGALVARELGTGLVLARKEGQNHPGADTRVSSAPTWRGRPESFQGRSFDLRDGQRVLLVDDWITTGNTLRAARDIVHWLGASLVGTAVLVDKAEPATLDELGVHALVRFDDVMARAAGG